MIIKSTSLKRVSSIIACLHYNIADTSKTLNKEGKRVLVKHLLTGNTIREWADQFLENEKKRKQNRRNSVRAYHDIISWSPEDSETLSLEEIEEVARRYIEERCHNTLAVAVAHFDRPHIHVHVVISGVDVESGRSMRISKQELSEIKKQMTKRYEIQKPTITGRL